MHLVLLHGYLLQGTGSNIYVANIAKAWKKKGHRVTVICQDPKAGALPFVNEYIGPNEKLPATPPQPGTIRVVVPAINDLLPVYVLDRYDGYRVKRIPEMTPDEINDHIGMTASSLREAALQHVDRILANHAILGPIIARRAVYDLQVPYDVKIHGSSIEYSLVPYPHLMTYAYEGLEGAKKVFVGTQYVKDRVLEVFSGVSEHLRLEDKLRIVPPGLDPDLFIIADSPEKNQKRFIEKIKAKLKTENNGRHYLKIPEFTGQPQTGRQKNLVKLGDRYDQRAVDSDLLDKWPRLRLDEPIILYIGKFLAEKGVGELLVAVPELLKRIPQVRFIFVGFGSYREHMECMVHALGQGDRGSFVSCARADDFVGEINFKKWFRQLLPEELGRITITGMLAHEELCELLPLASLVVVPSKLAEAFGMVAVESMAAGALPLCNYYAGLRDVIDDVESVSAELASLMKMQRDDFLNQLPEKIQTALNFLYPEGYHNHATRRDVAEKLRKIAVDKFSWGGIANRLLQ